MNKLIILGRLVKEAELKGNAEKVFAVGTVAVNGRRNEDALFLDFIAFGKTAELLNTIGKGKQVLLEGRLAQDKYETKDGRKAVKTKLVVEAFHFVGAKKDEADNDVEF